MKLTCSGRYSNGRVAYQPGQEFEVDDATGRWLLTDSPGSFQIFQPPAPVPAPALEPEAEPEDKALAEAPEDKMLRPNRRTRAK